jgi:hypothetical protein
VRSYLLSWLAKKYEAADRDAFVRAEPHDWLVWEAGPWRPPARGRDTIQARPGMPGLNSGESLAISIEPAAGAQSVTVGRSTENDVVIDDATLSRVHMRLERGEGGRWSAVDLGSSNGTTVDGVLARGQAVPLKSGSVLEAGAVRLTFYDGGGFYLRLTGKP